DHLAVLGQSNHLSISQNWPRLCSTGRAVPAVPALAPDPGCRESSGALPRLRRARIFRREGARLIFRVRDESVCSVDLKKRRILDSASRNFFFANCKAASALSYARSAASVA